MFSQFTSHLALIREELDKAHVPYLYLDGSTSAQERSKLVRQFQTGDDPLFLISLKAGGLGLNLTAADFTNINGNFTDVTFVIKDGTLEIAKRTVTLTSADEVSYLRENEPFIRKQV